jgi:dienelactone hydrolase
MRTVIRKLQLYMGGPIEDHEPGIVRRRRTIAASILVVAAAAVLLVVVLASAGRSAHAKHAPPAGLARAAGARASLPAKSAKGPFAVGLRVLRLVDRTRTVSLPDGTRQPRTLVTYVRYPALGRPGQSDLRDAPVAHAGGPFPLIVFGHGFALTPTAYRRLLQSWARAGYVVAAPVFPLENANAPGGPDESDLTSQPADMSLVISRLLAASTAQSGPLASAIDLHEVAVAGHSDGGDTALATAYDPRYRDSRVVAAVVLSGAEMPGTPSFHFAPSGPPLLATQGTADTINPPSASYQLFEAAHRPKFLLRLLGAEHLGPYSNEYPQLGIVERVTTAFLDAYVKRIAAARVRLSAGGDVARLASLSSEP